MIARIISQAEADAIIVDDEAENLPFRVLNAAGQRAVAEFVRSSAANADRHDLNAWYADAERVANDSLPDESIIVEMRGMHTASGNPQTVALKAECFDWMIND